MMKILYDSTTRISYRTASHYMSLSLGRIRYHHHSFFFSQDNFFSSGNVINRCSSSSSSSQEKLISNNPGRVVVAGAGTIGCFVGGWLSNVGFDVRLLVRDWMKETLNRHGLTFQPLDQNATRLQGDALWSSDPDCLSEADVVLVTVKSGATATIAEDIARFCRPGVPVISFQNGVDNPRLLREICVDQVIVAGMVKYNVVNVGEGRFIQASEGELWVGEGAEAMVTAIESKSIPIRLDPDMEGILWGKLLLNLNNPINALSDLPLKEQLSMRGYRHIYASCIREALACYEVAGIVPKSTIPIPARWIPALMDIPDWIFRRIANSIVAISPDARSSMWEDVKKGRRTEFADINGKIVQLGDKYDIPTPYNSKLQELITGVENGVQTIGLNPEQLMPS